MRIGSLDDTVFLLGAGFSRAVFDGMPLMADLAEAVLVSAEIPEWPPELGDNVEVVLSYLAVPQPWKTEDELLAHRASALRLTSALCEAIDFAQGRILAAGKSPPGWLSHLVAQWHSRRSRIVTFNYDLLVEATFANMLTQVKIEGDKESELHGADAANQYIVPMQLARGRSRLILRGKFVATMQVLKLHGSVNWYYSGPGGPDSDPAFLRFIPDWGQDSWIRYLDALHALPDKVPMIVPPQSEKGGLFGNQTVRTQWREAANAMRDASRLVIIGYSLPDTDMTVRLMLRAFAPKSVDVVDPSEYIVERYRQALPDRDVRWLADEVASADFWPMSKS